MVDFQDKRAWLGAGAAAAVVLAAGGWFLVLHPVIADKNDLKAQAGEVAAQNQVLQTKVIELKRQYAGIGSKAAELRAKLAELPPDSGLPEFTRQLTAQARANHVILDSIEIGAIAPAAGGAVGGTDSTGATQATPGTTAPAGDDGTAGAAGTTGTTTGTAGAPTATVTGQPASIRVTLTVQGSAAADLAFLRAVQVAGPRRVLVSTSSMSGSVANNRAGLAKLTVSVDVFSTPRTVDEKKQLAELLKLK
jgi:hypothetical protein